MKKSEETKLEELKHKNKMKEIEFQKDCLIEVEKLKMDHAMQLQRIKTAEIRRAHERKEHIEYLKSQGR